MAADILNWGEQPSETKSAAAPAAGARQRIVSLLFALSNLKIAHWQAPTKTNEHRALGDLYDTASDLLDTLTEKLIGNTKDRGFPESTGRIGGQDGYTKLVDEIRTLVTGLYDDLKDKPGLSNIAQDLVAAVDNADFFLLP